MNEKYCPTKKEINQKINSGKYPIFQDGDGRLWGFVDNNILTQDFKREGFIDDKERLLMWIFLPNIKKGKFKNTRSPFGEAVLSGQELNFPSEYEKLTLYDYKTNRAELSIQLMEYPMRTPNRYRNIDCAIVDVQN